MILIDTLSEESRKNLQRIKDRLIQLEKNVIVKEENNKKQDGEFEQNTNRGMVKTNGN